MKELRSLHPFHQVKLLGCLWIRKWVLTRLGVCQYQPPELWEINSSLISHYLVYGVHAEADRGPKVINLPSFLEKSHQPLWSRASLPFLPLLSPARFNSVTSSVFSSSISPDTRFPEASDPGVTLRAFLSHHSHEEQFYLMSIRQHASDKSFASSYYIWDLHCLVWNVHVFRQVKRKEWNKKGWAF